ncbi:dihydroxyacetone kinase subunit DhaK [Larsenimonas suaedae]|uniref:Dihydroxyacetone kinase subunit DhaK n=1 Tax=Larsenimonas suaedae TaxID=1851019 RepID=A0ABU1GSH4_9GAMM|nr:dihydroxyacetone kinase subunit DhaK [Larsenimonas suaedae]MCM2972224.1 dihydroxyacetone kinase subunit DhaK [Larsenimonas suaedae]MDR5894980.1 dihydroxyacetone kinase subunit DhaK [Larsenimonas suaedae]
MKRFYNAPEQVVDEVLEADAHLRSVRLSSRKSGMRILVRDDWDKNDQGRTQVALLSGGGAGHEPAHAGFVGEGMLTCAVSGSVFASPSVDAVMAGLREVCGEAGCLMIVKNYTGDRLNFGLAAERARAEGLKVDMVIVSDDIALDDAPQPRGIAGTIAIHKIAGYYAAQGTSLDELRPLIDDAASRLASLGMALDGATLPGQEPSPRSPELGLGIHNETGAKDVSPKSAREALKLVLEPLMEAMQSRHGPKVQVIALLNNLGRCTSQEMMVLTHALLESLGPDRLPMLIGPAPMMTSLDMHGFSITLLPFESDLETALSAPATAPGWPGIRHVTTPDRFEPDVSDQNSVLTDNAPQEERIATALRQVTASLIDAREELDALDAKSGDGDAGASFEQGARAIEQALDDARLPTERWVPALKGIGELLARDMGGSSGVLLSILFTTTSAALEESDGDWAHALAQGVERMQTYGGAHKGDRTMLDALIPAIDAVRDGGDLKAMADAARQGANATAEMKEARAGRASYIPGEKLDGVTDPGAEAVARAINALAT